MSDSPENWLDEVLEAHAREWIGLPVIQLKAVMTGLTLPTVTTNYT